MNYLRLIYLPNRATLLETAAVICWTSMNFGMSHGCHVEKHNAAPTSNESDSTTTSPHLAVIIANFLFCHKPFSGLHSV